MKTFIAIVLIILLFACLVFLGIPFIIEKENSKLRSEIQGLKTKIETLEKFKSSQEIAWKMTGLKPGDDFLKIIKAVNNLSSKITNLENYTEKRISAAENELKEQVKTNNELAAKQSETIIVLSKDITAISRKVSMNAIATIILARILESKIELVSRNIGNVKASLQAISGELQKAKDLTEDTNKKVFDDLNAIVGNIKSELDVSLSGANNMINLLLYEFEKTMNAL